MNWTAKKVRQLRQTMGMTQAQFADCLGVTRVHVAHLEMGVRAPGQQSVRLLDYMSRVARAAEVKAVTTTKKRRRTKG